MANTKNINLRVDADLKLQAEAIFSELGIPTSTAINIFLKSVVRYGGIPLDMRLNSGNSETMKAIDDVNHHRNLSPTYDRVDELMRDLNA